MAIGQFVWPTRGINETRGMYSPARPDLPNNWLKELRKVIPQIPKTRSTDWIVSDFAYDLHSVSIDMITPMGDKCYIRINRQRGLLTI